jgi:TonB-linked SusC/RagA family outer membrane protein
MRTYKVFIASFTFLLFTFGGFGQQGTTITGTVTGPYKNPIKGAIITFLNQTGSATSDSLGNFSLDAPALKGIITVWAPGYYDTKQPVLNGSPVHILMVPTDKYRYNQSLVMPLNNKDPEEYRNSQNQNINRKDVVPGTLFVEDVLHSGITGLQVTQKSGMPGEGSVLNIRGTRSMVGNNSPLIVLNGVPYLPDQNQSSLIGSYSQSVFNNIDINDIENITFLKGADAALYGSLGANGVILIETSKANDFETTIEVSGQYGLATNTRTLPLLNVTNFKSYIGDVGLTKYDDAGEMLTVFPFLKDDPSYYYKFLYNNNTDWQSLIYNTAFVTENNLHVKGGDAVAKYDFSLGMLDENGVLKNTSFKRYNTRVNANFTLGKNVDLFSSIGLSYSNNDLHEQGMLDATNPILTALYKAPILSPYAKDEYNHELPDYDVVRQFHVSNPLAAVNTIKMGSATYDIFFNTGINFRVTNDLKVSGLFGLYYNYNRQTAFVPGKDSHAIVPLNDSIAENTERAGVGQTLDLYFNVNSAYNKSFDRHGISAGLGVQGLITDQEFDAGEGRNTNSDFYQTLTNVTAEGRKFWGYTDNWNWLSMYGYLGYDFSKILFASVNVSMDGSSSSGSDANRFGIFPSGKITWKGKNMRWFQNSTFLNQLDVHAEYSVTGNSRFSSNLSKYYYTSQAYQELTAITRGNIPNTGLTHETTGTSELGMELSVLMNRIHVTADYYDALSKDVIMSVPISSVFGINHIFDNAAEIRNKGFELGLQAEVLKSKDFEFILGGTMAMNKNKLEKLGGQSQQITELGDGSAIISKVGESVYNFYGYISDGVFSNQADANTAALTDYKGDSFNAGDMKFRDKDNNHVISDTDRYLIGNANPDYFGTFFGNIRYKNLSLSANFSYSVGNKMYNAVRRSLESESNFYNQSAAVTRRWQAEGQKTDIPQVKYGDPMNNSRFSDRWIEDASYLRLNNVTLSYRLPQKLFKTVRGGTVYVSGENLFTLSDYLGLDPVTAYSYDPMMQGIDYAKLALPRTFKFGIKLQF